MNKISTGFLLLLMICISCQRERPVLSCPGREIAFGASLSATLVGVDTKAAPLASLESFYVTASTGTPGSDVPVWYNREFTGGPVYTGDVFWPDEDEGYLFYASSVPVASTYEGVTVDVDGSEDVVCAYRGDAVYGEPNTLTFKHIFSRLGSVTVQAAEGYSVSDVTIAFTPVTGGRYDLYEGAGHTDRTGWTRLVRGASATLYSGAAGTAAKSLWLVPGTYEGTASWTVHKDEDTYDVVDEPMTFTLGAGRIESLTFTLGAPEGAFVPHLPSFGGINIAPAPLYYDGTTFVIKDDDWNHDSYNDVYGRVEGSYCFSMLDLAAYFDTRGTSYTPMNGNMNVNAAKVSWGGYTNWRPPTMDEQRKLFTTNTSIREGSRVNGSANKHYALIQLTGVTHAGTSTPNGLLLFPDGKVITGKALSGMDNTTQTTGVTAAQLQNYLDQGCAFLPASGGAESGVWKNGGSVGKYPDTTASSGKYCSYLSFSRNTITTAGYMNALPEKQDHGSVRLVRFAD